MAKFKLTRSNFSIVPEGHHTFHIDQVQYNEAFGKMQIRMTADGKYKHTEQFNLLNNSGEPIEKAMNSFTFLAKCALNNFSDDEFDEQDLVGCEFEGDIEHWVSDTKVDEEGNPRKYANLTRKYPIKRDVVEPADDASIASEETAPASVADLLSALGM